MSAGEGYERDAIDAAIGYLQAATLICISRRKQSASRLLMIRLDPELELIPDLSLIAVRLILRIGDDVYRKRVSYATSQAEAVELAKCAMLTERQFIKDAKSAKRRARRHYTYIYSYGQELRGN